MDPDDLRAYASRDWSRIDALKRGRWRARSPRANFELAAEIYAHVRRSRPDWPTPESRRADLEHHISLAHKLRACRRRPAD